MAEVKEQKKKAQPEPKKGEVVISIKGLKKSFGKKHVLTDINLEVHKGENVVVLGRSGQGKSVAIQCVVGMLIPDAGALKVLGKDVTDLNDNELKDLRMKIGFLFQTGALYDSMTVRENLEFPLTRVLKLKDRHEIDERVLEMLEGVNLADAAEKIVSAVREAA